MTRVYLSTHDLRDRLRCSSRTIFRSMKRKENPFPAPCMKHYGSCNLWDRKSVLKWEKKEKQIAKDAA